MEYGLLELIHDHYKIKYTTQRSTEYKKNKIIIMYHKPSTVMSKYNSYNDAIIANYNN